MAGSHRPTGESCQRPASHRPRRLDAKKKSLIASERDEAARTAFRQTATALDPTRVVFLDEAGCFRDATRLYSRAPRGQRALGHVPRNRGPGVTVIASLSMAGIGPTMTLDGGTSHADFFHYLDAVLLPTLVAGTTIVLDNLSAHRPRAVRERITAAGCQVCYLPSYSPDLNPIELAFGVMKAGMRQRGVRRRADLPDAMQEELATITPAMAVNWIRHCGYTGQAQ